MRVSLILLSSILFGATMALDTFYITADARFELPNGHYNATMYYKYDGSGAKQHYLRFDYTKPISMMELIDFKEGVKYKVCSSKCEAGYYTSPAPVLAKQAGDSYNDINENGCKRYIPADTSGASAIWYTDAGEICRVELPDKRIFSLTNIKKTAIDASKFKPGAACPAPVCKRVMDLVFVIDISGSVGSNNWNKVIKPFVKNLTNSFDVGTDATQIGLLTYGSSAREVFRLSGDKKTIINKIDQASYTGGNTCTGCGIHMGMTFLNDTKTHRSSLDPEKIMIVMTDGNNYRHQGVPCANYEAKCITRGPNCKKYKCSTEYRTESTSVCSEYKDSSTCKRYRCTACNGDWGTACVNQTCKTWGTNCAKRDMSYCEAAYPSGCKVSGGKLTKTSVNSVPCICSQYKCIENECTDYNCNEYACDSCKTHSTVCSEYEKVCAKYATRQVCDGVETCEEYECLEGEAVCVNYVNSDASSITGAIIRTRTEWSLYPATKRLPIVISIGVGSVSKNELYAIASTLEGKTFMYLVNDFKSLSTLFDDLIDETCIKQTDNLESCDAGCKGFCGCNKQCYCPTCDASTGSCYSIGCTVFDQKTTNGCVADHTDCSVSDKCKIPSANNNTKGCCSYTNRVCTPPDKCHESYCDTETGCVTKSVTCVPENSCFNHTGCNPATGCTFIDACPDLGPCKIMSCSPVDEVKFNCYYEDKCKSDDPCMLPVCNPDTGDCSLEPMPCIPSNPCRKSTCFNGVCIEEDNITKKIECSSQAKNACEEGYCNETTGKCETRDITGSTDCNNCIKNTSLACSEIVSECYVYSCAPGEPDGSTSPTKCVREPTMTNSNPCIELVCVSEELGWESRNYSCGEPKDACHSFMCVPDPDDPTKPLCKEMNNFDFGPEVDGRCKIAFCNESGLPDVKDYCPQKNCMRLVGCDPDTDGDPVCTYEPIVCEENHCTKAFCNAETGQCEYVSNASECDPHNPCQTFECSNTSGCKVYDISCDDKNNCTEDKCVVINSTSSDSKNYTSEEIENGYVCVHIPKCVKPSFCWTASCDANGACSYLPYDCDDLNNNSTLDSCHTYKCDDEAGKCKVTLNPAAFLSICGDCLKIVADDSTFSEEYESTKCVAGMKLPDFAATIGGAAVAGIVVAAVIVAAVIGISSTIGTKELIKRAKKNADVGTNSNPLYEDNDNEAVNPAFVEKN